MASADQIKGWVTSARTSDRSSDSDCIIELTEGWTLRRFFEGTPQDAHQALAKLEKLPGETQCYVGHNYTASNLRFAQHVGNHP